MIKFRQKEYSNILKKVIRGGKKVTNKTGVTLTKKLSPTSKLKVHPKSNYQLNRETIETVQGMKEAGPRAVLTPINNLADNGIKYAAENPIAGVASPIPIPGSTAIGLGAEKLSKLFVPGYDRVTKKAQEKYTRSKLSQTLKRTRLPSINELTQVMPI